MSETARIVSVRAGRVREHVRPDWDHHAERTWRTAYVKDELAGAATVSALGIDGDEVASKEHHGGVDMAVLAYAVSHYAAWRIETGLSAMGPGALGENLALEGPGERDVCIGDRWESDHVAFEVSQPRAPCAAISRIWDRERLLAEVTASGRTGWYLRVTRPGTLRAGETLRRVARPHPEWTVERVFRARVETPHDLGAARALAQLPALSPPWRGLFAARLA